MRKKDEKMTKPAFNKAVAMKCRENHIWVNAFSCINPTDAFKIQLANDIIAKLRDPDALLPSDGITSDNKTIRELAELTPMLYIAINKS